MDFNNDPLSKNWVTASYTIDRPQKAAKCKIHFKIQNKIKVKDNKK